jgi:putative ABC transport system substrate-binding protein
MRRRDLLALIGGAAVLGPGEIRAQPPDRIRRVGMLIASSESDPFTRAAVTAFEQTLGRLGWVKGRNIRIDYRFAEGNSTLFKTYAAELVGLSPDAILASTPPAVLALQQQTRTIPIVFILVLDPVGQGLVQNLARPGGNITGFGAVDAPIMGKWLQLLKEAAPRVTRVAIIFNPDTQPYATFFNRAIEAAAASVGVTVRFAPVYEDAAIDETVAAQARPPDGSLIALPDSFNFAHRDVIIAAATRYGVPLIGFGEVFPRGGALMSYWYDSVDVHAQAASYIDHILKGARPADLPVQYPTKYSLIINLKTAKALGLSVPPALLAEANEIVE